MRQGNGQAGGRHYGIDLLRLTAMCFVVVLHTLGQGGILAAAPAGSAVYRAAWGLEALAFCAVDIFALISGYVAYSDAPRRTKLSAWLLLWLEVVCYAVGVTLVFCALRPDAAPLGALRGMYLPVKNDLYWYFTAYTGLFLIRPVLDAGLRAVSEKTARRVFGAVFLGFSLYGALGAAFRLNQGYSFAWITLLYVMGAAMRKAGIGARVRPAAAGAGVVVCTALTWAWKLGCGALPEALQRMELMSYVSPTVLGAALCWLLLFLRVRPGGVLRAVIGFAAPGAFAVYLLNTHRYVWTLVMENRFAALAAGGAGRMALAVVGFALAFTATAVGIDFVRRKLEGLLRIGAAARAVGGWIERAADRILGGR